MAEDDIKTFKAIILGCTGVGKTSLITRLANEEYTDEPEDLDSREIIFERNGTTYRILINDTAGQERFRALTSSYYRYAHAIIAVYDITNQESFADIEGYISEGTQFSPSSLKFLVGNKTDLFAQRVISEQDGSALAELLGISFLEASAHTEHNTDALLDQLQTDLANEFPDGKIGGVVNLKKNKSSGKKPSCNI